MEKWEQSLDREGAVDKRLGKSLDPQLVERASNTHVALRPGSLWIAGLPTQDGAR